MNLLYPLGTESKWNDNELRYSIRSFEKYNRIDKLIVVGDRKPEWLDPRVFRYYPDESSIAAQSTLLKVVYGLANFKPEDIVWLVDDDYFLLHEFPESELRPSKETVREIVNRTPPKSKTYGPRKATFDLIDQWGIPNARCFDLHYPFWVKPWIFERLYITNLAHQYKTVYALLTDSAVVCYNPVAQIKDEKDFHMFIEKQKNIFLPSPEVLTTGNNIVLNPLIQNWLSENYPKESKYELSRP